jgi:hypothetical protein
VALLPVLFESYLFYVTLWPDGCEPAENNLLVYGFKVGPIYCYRDFARTDYWLDYFFLNWF